LWSAVEVRARVAELHADDPALICNGRVVVVRKPTSGAIVLGSTQPAAGFDEELCHEHDLEIARRRSGGGAVLVRPGAQIWIDFFVPRSDPLFLDDVVKSFRVIGDLWAQAIRSLDMSGDSVVATSPATAGKPDRWSRLLCWAGIGASEVTIGGRKAVGISQRRDRAGAWFHSMALLDREVAEVAMFLADPALRGQAARRLEAVSTALPGGRSSAPDVTDAVLRGLPGGVRKVP
jgi:lipoate---protein ligase